jgi:hypothetical protein
MAFLLLPSAKAEDSVKTREVSMPEQKDRIVEMVKETGASLGQAITAAVETATDYLTPGKSRPAATKKRTTTAQPSKAAARTQRKKTATQKTRTAASTKRAMSTRGRKKTVKPRIAAKQKKAA